MTFMVNLTPQPPLTCPEGTRDGEGEQAPDNHDVCRTPRYFRRNTPLHRNGEGQGVRFSPVRLVVSCGEERSSAFPEGATAR